MSKNPLTLIRLKDLPVELSLGICLLLLQHLDLLDVLLLLNDPSGLGGLSGRGHADAGGGLGLAGGVDGPWFKRNSRISNVCRFNIDAVGIHLWK